MEYQNITLSIPKDILKKARIIAIQHQQSLSGMVAEYIRQIVENETIYEQAHQRQISMMEQGLENLSVVSDREALHERR